MVDIVTGLNPEYRKKLLKRSKGSKNAEVPKGSHKMPDGTVMKDSEHRKPVKAGMGGMLQKLFGSSDIFKVTGATSANPRFLKDFKQYKDDATAARFQKTTNAKQVKSGGEIVVGKGSDYIKDLID